MLVLAALAAGACVATVTLWVTGYGALASPTSERLGRLRTTDEPLAAQAVGLSLRRRAQVNFGGINLVSSRVVQQWTLQLERAGLTLNAREYFILRVIVGLVFTMIGMLVLPVPQLALLAAPLGYVAVGFWLKRRVSKRQHTLEGQLIEMLQMLSSALRAGFGLIQALDSCAEQLPAPLSVEIRRTLRDTAMGASIDHALLSLNDRVGSADFDIVITAILIQRTVGGNLAEILDNVAHTMRERERIRGEIRTLTSQQRMTGYVIGCIPVGLGVIFSIISPDFMSVMFTENLGRMMLLGAVCLEVVGFFVISRIVNIEV